jgi:pyridoxamine 5'-phosphate oxidase
MLKQSTSKYMFGAGFLACHHYLCSNNTNSTYPFRLFSTIRADPRNIFYFIKEKDFVIFIFLLDLSKDDIQSLRKEYSASGLDELNLPENPMNLFVKWLNEAVDAKVLEPNAMFLATVDEFGQPHGRVVLLKEIDETDPLGKFVFYTNYESNKAQQLEKHDKASLVFFWGDLERSVRISGVVEKISEEQSQAYFAKRPRGSQLGAWASHQSREIANREEMEQNYNAVEERFKDVKEIPKPPFWGGFCLRPHRIEFWKGRSSRFHDRIEYTLQKDNTTWTMRRLQP